MCKKYQFGAALIIFYNFMKDTRGMAGVFETDWQIH